MAFGANAFGIHMISKQWEDWMKETHEKLKKRKDTNAKCVLHVDKWVQENFKTQGVNAIGGRGWEPLSDFTKAMRLKGKKGASLRILEDRGFLKNRWKRFYTDTEAYIESGVDYAWKHELGDPNNTWNGRPAPIHQRKILPQKNQVWEGIQKIYKLFLGKVLK